MSNESTTKPASEDRSPRCAVAPCSALDGTARLCRTLYLRKEEPRDYIGGSEARMLHDAAEEIERLRAALKAALPVLDEHADDERSFWGAEDKHGLGRDAEQIYQQAKTALSPNDQAQRPGGEGH